MGGIDGREGWMGGMDEREGGEGGTDGREEQMGQMGKISGWAGEGGVISARVWVVNVHTEKRPEQEVNNKISEILEWELSKHAPCSTLTGGLPGCVHIDYGALL